MENNSIPTEFQEFLSDYGPQIFDSNCGEPIGWGYRIIKHLGDERMNKLSEYGDIECCYPGWFLVTKKLTRVEAMEKYGPIKNEERGPRGGFRSVEFGDKKFINKNLDI